MYQRRPHIEQGCAAQLSQPLYSCSASPPVLGWVGLSTGRKKKAVEIINPTQTGWSRREASRSSWNHRFMPECHEGNPEWGKALFELSKIVFVSGPSRTQQGLALGEHQAVLGGAGTE